MSFVADGYPLLQLCAEAVPRQLCLQRALIYTVEKTVTEMIVNLKSGPDDGLRNVFVRKSNFVFRFEFEHSESVSNLC